jgi:hypothetical protein
LLSVRHCGAAAVVVAVTGGEELPTTPVESTAATVYR